MIPSDEELAAAAEAAGDRAYSPYSGVRVGAALLAADGRVFSGCNVENASFGLTLCAERTALVKAISEGAREFQAIAVWSSPERPLMPCGACRQMLHEFAPELRVIVAGRNGERQVLGLAELLPRAIGFGDVAPSG